MKIIYVHFGSRNEYRIDPRSYEPVLEKWPEKNSGPYGIWTHDLCDTSVALYQLSLLANWKLVNKPSKW